jgi:hypothetical protein
MVGQDEVLPEDLLPLLLPLHEYVEGAIQEAHQFFESRQWPVDPWMFCHQVRLYVRQQLFDLSSRGVTCEHVRLAFSGIELTYQGWRLKILKAERDGSIPGPGRSYAKQAYYNYNLFPDDEEEEEPSHLVIIWHIDQHYNFLYTKLCDPSTGHVFGTIPHPVTLPHASQQPTTSQGQDLPQLDLPEDLNIEEAGSDQP